MMRLKISRLHKYILSIWLLPFVGILLLVTGVFMLQKVLIWLPLLIENDVPFILSMQLFSALLPSVLLMVIPIAYFFGLYKTVKQVQENSELDAMYAGGLSLFNIFVPVLVAGLFLSLLLLWLMMDAIPSSKLQIFNVKQQLSSLKAAPAFSPNKFETLEGISFYSEGKNIDGSYANVMISDAREDMYAPTVYLAKRATIKASEGGLFIHLVQGNQISGEKNKLNLTHFDAYLIQVPVHFEARFQKRDNTAGIEYMDGLMLYDYLRKDKQAKSLAEWDRRWIPSISLLILFFIAVPLALQAKRSQKSGSFLIALVVLAILDESQYIVYRKIGIEVLPLWTTWALEAVYAGIALWLFFIVNKHGNLSFKNMKRSLGNR